MATLLPLGAATAIQRAKRSSEDVRKGAWKYCQTFELCAFLVFLHSPSPASISDWRGLGRIQRSYKMARAGSIVAQEPGMLVEGALSTLV